METFEVSFWSCQRKEQCLSKVVWCGRGSREVMTSRGHWHYFQIVFSSLNRFYFNFSSDITCAPTTHHSFAIFLSRICCRTKTAATHKVINSQLKWVRASKKSAFPSQSSAAHLLVKLFQWIIATALRKEPSQLITNWAEYESPINSSFCELLSSFWCSRAESMIRGDWKWKRLIKVLADAAFFERLLKNRRKRQNNNKIVN